MVVHTAHGDLGHLNCIWGSLGGSVEDFGSSKFVLLKDFALCKTFWIFRKIRAAQNRVAQIRVAQGPPVVNC